jgi:hypothetical protein
VGLRRVVVLRLRAVVLAVASVSRAVAYVSVAALVPVAALAVVAVVVLDGVVAAVAVAGVPVPLTVAVVFVALPVPVVRMVALGALPFVAGSVVVAARRAVGIGLLADSGLRGRGDASAARAFRGRDPWADCGARWRGGARGTGCAGGRCCSDRAGRGGGRVGLGTRRLRCAERGRDGGAGFAGSGGRSGNGSLLARQVEKPWRCQNEADRSQHGEQADCGCGYARKTTPH